MLMISSARIFSAYPSRLISVVLSSFLLTAIVGCQSNKAIIDYDTDIDFSNYHYYQLLEELSGATEEVNPLLVERTKTALQAHLIKASFAPATATQAADILVRYYISSQTQSKESNARSSIGLGGGSGGAAMGVSLSFPLGGNKVVKDTQIIVDLVDPEDKKVKWRGTKNFKLSDESPEQVTKIVNATIAEILSFYPPDTSSK